MDFNPGNPIVKLTLQGMAMEENGKPQEAGKLFFQAWEEATNDLEKFIAAYHIGRHETNAAQKLKWLETALQFAKKIDTDTVKSAYPTLYFNIAKCYEDLNQPEKANENFDLATSFKNAPSDKGPFYHGTRADLKVGDLLTPGGLSNYQAELKMNHIYFTGNINGAGLAAALAKSDKPERVYIIEPTGIFENDPNVTDKKFPGNPTRSYRSDSPLKITGEVLDWERITPEELQKWRERLASSNGEIIN